MINCALVVVVVLNRMAIDFAGVLPWGQTIDGVSVQAQVTPEYAPPEVGLGKLYNTALLIYLWRVRIL